MKKLLSLFFAVSLFAACSNPVLKWIDTPEGDNSRVIGQLGAKEILSFTFGIEGETDLPIGKIPDGTGKYPISIILPIGSSVGSLSPEITYIGENLDPPSGKAGNFTSPVVYTVTAEDGSTRDYIVKVYVKDDASKAIVRFTLDVSGTGDLALSAEGIIDEAAGTIVVGVPVGTDAKSLTAHVAHTGMSVTGPLGNPHPAETFDFVGNFSAPTTWTVIARNYTTKTYTVTVVREKNDEKRITDFSFGISGEDVIIGDAPRPDGKYPILAVVPESSSATLGSKKPFVSYIGASISPGPDTFLDFSNPAYPVPYTVTAEDRTTRDYVVTVIRKDNGFDSLKQITGFYFTDPLVEGIIDEVNHTIALTVPAGTNVSALRPEIYYVGASISPRDGQPGDFTGSDTTPVTYTVRARDGTIQPYQVSVFATGAPFTPKIDVSGTDGEKVDISIDVDGNYTVIVELPVFINNPILNVNPGGGAAGGSTSITNNNVFNNTTIKTGDDNEYNIIVINPSPDTPANAPSNAASIDGFYFNSPAAVGVIGKTDGTEGEGTAADPYRIAVNVPYGTDLRNLAATICYTGKEITGIPGPNPLKAGARSFTDPVDYTVNADDRVTAKTYRVTVTALPNNAREITDFSFNGIDTSAVISAMPNAEGDYPIVVTVPQGQVITGLTPVITYTGKSISGDDGISDNNGPGTVQGSSYDFSNTITSANPVVPVDYTVSAEDGSTRTYAVTVRRAVLNEDDVEITGFYFAEPLAVGLVNQDTNSITVTVPSTTDVTSLRPTVYFKGMSVKPGSGAVNNFSGPVTYTVTGNSGKTRPYAVTVNTAPSSAKDITRFTFPGILNTETVIGAVPDADGTYPLSVRVPSGTALTNLAPDITHTGVRITPAAGTPGNFSAPQTYTVTAEDGSVKTYKVTVYPQDGDVKIITSLVFEEVPLSGGGSIRVVASINQAAHTIMAEVPSTAGISSLAPTLTWIGRTIAGPSGGDKTANPFTDTARDFNAAQTYTVKDQNNTGQAYAVTVIRKSSVGIQFEGEKDKLVASSTFNQNTGLITVTVGNDPNTGISPPYEWYVDGVKQTVANTEFTFTLNVGDGTFLPGRHEIMVSGKQGGLHYTGRVYFMVSGS
jgi:hypothetical protein